MSDKITGSIFAESSEKGICAVKSDILSNNKFYGELVPSFKGKMSKENTTVLPRESVIHTLLSEGKQRSSFGKKNDVGGDFAINDVVAETTNKLFESENVACCLPELENRLHYSFFQHNGTTLTDKEKQDLVVAHAKRKKQIELLKRKNVNLLDDTDLHCQESKLVDEWRSDQEVRSFEKIDYLHKNNVESSRNILVLPESDANPNVPRFHFDRESNVFLQKKMRAQEETIEKLNDILLNLSEKLAERLIEKENVENYLIALNQQARAKEKEQTQVTSHYTNDLRTHQVVNNSALQKTEMALAEAQKQNCFLLSAYHTFSLNSLSSVQKLLSLEEQNTRLNIEKSYFLSCSLVMCAMAEDLKVFITEKNNVISQSSQKNEELKNSIKKTLLNCEELRTRYGEQDIAFNKQAKAVLLLERRLSEAITTQTKSRIVNKELERENTFLKNQTLSLTEELSEIDNAVVSQMASHANVTEELQRKCNDALTQLHRITMKDKLTTAELSSLRNEYVLCQLKCATLSKSLDLAKDELHFVSNQEKLAIKEVSELSRDLRDKESKNRYLVASVDTAERTIKNLRSQVEESTITFNGELKRYNDEIKSFKEKLSVQEKKISDHEISHSNQMNNIKQYQASISTLQESLADLKGKSLKDINKLCDMQKDRDRLKNDNDQLLQKINVLKQEGSTQLNLVTKISEDLRKITSLSSAQERNLEKIREENNFLKKSLSMLVGTQVQKTETVFTDCLNLTEGPLRHPKKRVKK